MGKKIKISIDIDGTINSSDTSVSFFQMMTHLLLPEAHITILTNREPGTEEKIAQELKQMKIQYDEIVITPHKQEYIKKNHISVVIDNEDEYIQGLGKDVLVLKAREEGNYNYNTHKWYGDRNIVEMIDES